jgi:hypothetical protein
MAISASPQPAKPETRRELRKRKRLDMDVIPQVRLGRST